MLVVFKVRAADGDCRGLLWVLDEEMMTPASSESRALERVCQYYSNTGNLKKKKNPTHKSSKSLSLWVRVWIIHVSLQCVSVSSHYTVRSTTWWAVTLSAMTSLDGLVWSRTIHLLWTPTVCCKTPKCEFVWRLRKAQSNAFMSDTSTATWSICRCRY